MYRPPAEAGSVIIRVADGCPHNHCSFCAMYKGVTYRIHPRNEQRHTVTMAARTAPWARRIFLADGDVLDLPMSDLRAVLDDLSGHFPQLARVNCYASGQSLTGKSRSELEELRRKGLHTVYLGLESGSETVLRRMLKKSTVTEMIDGCSRAHEAGLSVSTMVLIGAGGLEFSQEHVAQTARVLGVMQPRLLSCLRLTPIPGTLLANQIDSHYFHPLSEEESVRELMALLRLLPSWPCVFRADHSSNILPLAGRLPRDTPALIRDLEELLASGVLDKNSPGPLPATL